jgi:hypothetical protein
MKIDTICDALLDASAEVGYHEKPYSITKV